jgi:hypothetical protein
MIKRLAQAVVVTAAILSLSGCVLGGPRATASAQKPAAPDYQADVPPTPPAGNIRAICYNETDLTTIRSRMVQQELQVVTLQCQSKGGVRAYEKHYADFINKFKPEFATNSRSLQQLAGRKRFNVDVLVTEIANRTAQRAQVDKEFCSRGKRALDWAVDPKVTSLAQIPPPYDVGPEMKIWPCPSK